MSVWCGCHVNGRFLATAHWTFSSYQRLEAERINHCGTKKWNLLEKQQKLIQKNRSCITVKAHSSMTHPKQQKKLFDFFSPPLGHGCNRSHLRPNGGLEETKWFLLFLMCHWTVGLNSKILIQKNLRSFITVKAHCSITHLKEQKAWTVDVIEVIYLYTPKTRTLTVRLAVTTKTVLR